jgi:50S ribosomal subunit-associated GTPase HflX
MDFSPDKLRARFAELTKKYDAGDKKRTALQLERDGKGDKLTEAQRRAYAEKIRKLHAELAPIEQERGMISRALGGKTG